MTPEAFEQLVRDALAERDRQRRARLMDPMNYEAADSAFVAKVMQAAGYAEPEDTQQAKTRARRAARQNSTAAFGDSDASEPRR
jgi:hypothetical protein